VAQQKFLTGAKTRPQLSLVYEIRDTHKFTTAKLNPTWLRSAALFLLCHPERSPSPFCHPERSPPKADAVEGSGLRIYFIIRHSLPAPMLSLGVRCLSWAWSKDSIFNRLFPFPLTP